MVGEWTVGEYLDLLAARRPHPAGGVVAALGLAQSAALLEMAARSCTGPRFADRSGEVASVLARAGALRAAALEVAAADVRVVEAVTAAVALPRATDAERARRSAAIADAVLAAAEPQATAVGIGIELVGLSERLAGVGNRTLAPDVAAAADAAAAALATARTNVEVDVAGHADTPAGRRLAAALAPVDAVLRRAAALRERVRAGLAGTD